MNRRTFLRATGAATAAVLPAFRKDGLPRILAAGAATAGRSPESLAGDEDFWFEIQSAFDVDRAVINLNNGSVSPSARTVQQALHHYLDEVNLAPVYHQVSMEPQVETVRRRLAANFGCAPEEMAITRNTSEGMEICQLGIELKRGDEVLTTDQDYPRMLTTWEQRQRRDGIVLKTFSFPVPPRDMDDLYERFEKAITPRTRVIALCHITCYTGQIFPVSKICRMARSRGIATMVDGAHAFAHFPFNAADLDCDYYATSLHKWLCAPIGTGFLYVRKNKIPGTWPLMAAPEGMKDNIRKFEEIGTHPLALFNAISEAITFHEGIGVERKAARLRYLKDRWTRRLAENPRVKILSSFDPQQSCALGFMSPLGIDPSKLGKILWDKHRIITHPQVRSDYGGIRIAPNVYTTVEEVDAFCSAVESELRS
jgi:selenocysteine lyase/cysteine desulfurase